MKAILEIRGERSVSIQPYLPEEFCPSVGYLVGPIPEGFDCLINIVDCEGCFIESIKTSFGEPYYTTS